MRFDLALIGADPASLFVKVDSGRYHAGSSGTRSCTSGRPVDALRNERRYVMVASDDESS